jgi:hypothetical protein
MSNLSKPGTTVPAGTGFWVAVKKAAGRLQDWFVIQTVAVKLTVLVMTILIPVTSIYSFSSRPEAGCPGRAGQEHGRCRERGRRGVETQGATCRWSLAAARC